MIGTREPREWSQGAEGQNCENWTKRVRPSEQVGDGPREHEKDSDLRKIGITIGVRLVADLNDSNYRTEHD